MTLGVLILLIVAGLIIIPYLFGIIFNRIIKGYWEFNYFEVYLQGFFYMLDAIILIGVTYFIIYCWNIPLAKG